MDVAKPDLAALEAEKRQLEARLAEAREMLVCRVCLDRPVAAVFMPCAHLNTCTTCSASLTRCPLCRSPIHYAAPVILDWLWWQTSLVVPPIPENIKVTSCWTCSFQLLAVFVSHWSTSVGSSRYIVVGRIGKRLHWVLCWPARSAMQLFSISHNHENSATCCPNWPISTNKKPVVGWNVSSVMPPWVPIKKILQYIAYVGYKKKRVCGWEVHPDTDIYSGSPSIGESVRVSEVRSHTHVFLSIY